MSIDRDRFLKEGYIVVPEAIPPDQLESTRVAYEIMVDRQRKIWARERNPDDPLGGIWETSAQPRLNIGSMVDHLGPDTIKTVETWLHENIHGVSSTLLDVPDAGVTEMMLMCNPVRDYSTGGHRGWHRDMYPPIVRPFAAIWMISWKMARDISNGTFRCMMTMSSGWSPVAITG